MRAALGRNVVANLLSAASGIGASLVSLPIILPAVGDAGYGVWTIGLTFVLYLTIADAGFAPAVQRWTALVRGEDDLRQAARLLWTTVALYLGVGLLAGAVLAALAPSIADLFDFPAALRDEAVDMLRLVGLALVLSVLVSAVGNVLQGLERFVAIGFSTAAGAATYLGAVIVLLGAGRGIVGLAEATVLQQSVTLAGRVWALRDVIGTGAPALLPGSRFRELAVFSAKLQASVLSGLINTQSDKVVMGLVASAATLGQLGIASQLADAGRLVAGAALAPVMTALVVAVAAADRDALARQFGWAHRLWIEVVVGGTLIGLGALQPLLAAWLGPGYDQAALFGAFLVAGAGASLVGGVAIGYLRAIGRPGVEGRFGLVTVGLNVVATVPLAFALGPIGVVAGTFAAHALACAWLLRRFAREAPETDRPRVAELARPVGLALLAGTFAGAVGLVAVAALPQGVALVPIAAVTGLAFAAYLAAVTRRPLTPTGLRTLVLGLRQTV